VFCNFPANKKKHEPKKKDLKLRSKKERKNKISWCKKEVISSLKFEMNIIGKFESVKGGKKCSVI
jgi:hypothetical protein